MCDNEVPMPLTDYEVIASEVLHQRPRPATRARHDDI